MKPQLTAFLMMALAAADMAGAEAKPSGFREFTNGVPSASDSSQAGFLSVRGGRFVDGEGRQILLHGLSVISKSKAENYQSWQGPGDFEAMRDWGMNCIRLGIIWDGLEPQPGVFDEKYLKAVDQRIAWAKAAGIRVMLDMHQDLFSCKYSDGAPEWATLTDGLPHVDGGGVWSDAYLSSPAIQRAFDNFWTNKPCADGLGVQDHFARAWQHVARRYAHEPTVIGFDLFNEPNIGSGNLAAQAAMCSALARALPRPAGALALSPEEVAGMWMQPAGRSQLMTALTNIPIYRQVVDAGGPVYTEFERTRLMAMFQRVRDAIREVDDRHLIFLETSMSANMGIPSGITPVRGKDGRPDPLQAFAPHGYDIVVDTPDLTSASNERVDLIFERHQEKARELGLPMLIGEWGAFGEAGPAILPTARHTAAVFERLLCGDVYWAYNRGIEKAAFFPALQRPVPLCIAGTLLSYRSDDATGTFVCVWREEGKGDAPSEIYLPRRICSGRENVRVEPPGGGFGFAPAAPHSGNYCVSILPMGKGIERRLTVRAAAR
jgi:endoglycosylceramidase